MILLIPKIMATQKLEELTIEQLKKKNKGASALLLICFIVWIICILLLIYSIIARLTHQSSLAASVFVLFSVMFPVFIGRKKIREELKKRESLVN
jgi:Flp pilus assembly protein TadB